MLSAVVIFSIHFSENPLDSHDQTWDVLVRNLKYFSFDENIKYFWNTPEERDLASLRILYPFIISFVKPFVDIALTFSDSLSN